MRHWYEGRFRFYNEVSFLGPKESVFLQVCSGLFGEIAWRKQEPISIRWCVFSA